MGLATGQHPDLSCVVLHSRDEVVARGVTGARMPTVDADGVLSAIDAQSGGTWMGIHTRTGSFAVLSNVRNRAPRLSFESSSRGELVARVLRGDDAAVESGAFSAFNIFWGTLRPDGPAELKYGTSVPDGAGRWRARSTGLSAPQPASCRSPPQPPPQVSLNDLYADDDAYPTENRPGPTGTTGADAHETEDDPSPHPCSSPDRRGVCSPGICRFMSNESNCGVDDANWPKVSYLRAQTQRALSSVTALSGEVAARALLAQLDSALRCTDIPNPKARAHADSIARRMASEASPYSCEQERLLMKGPCVELLSICGRPYSTVSQTALIVSQSEGCAFFAHRKATTEFAEAAAGAAAAGEPLGGAPTFGPWAWHRVPLPTAD
jgi:uncharacterized protein with NRDE domain